MLIRSLSLVVIAGCLAPHWHPVDDGMTPGVWFERDPCGDVLSATTCNEAGCSTIPIIIWQHTDAGGVQPPLTIEAP